MTISPRLVGAAVIVLAIACAYVAGRWQQRGADEARYTARELAAVSAAREEEQRRTIEQARIAKDAKDEADRARSDARTAADVSERLRTRVAELLAKRPAAPAGGTTAHDPDLLLAELFRRADQRAGDLAQYADSARIAGQACARAYQALTPAE